MGAEHDAVFLSYASQDAEAARRISEALRAAGVEVWFDQSELRGGDAWDAKIRKQIKECALFVPVISANTQARREGYFRLEWKLADDRTHLMAKGTPFLLPLCIDETKDRDAIVPDSFMVVQWMRLPGGEATPEFVSQAKRLLGSGTGSLPAVAVDGGRRSPLQQAKSRFPRWAFAVLAAVMLIGGGAAFLATLRPAAPAPAAASPAFATAASRSPSPSNPPATDAKSIAVLPFENRSAEQDTAFFTDGVHEDILTTLGNIRELRVISRTSVLEYRGTTKKIPQIAQELGVAFVLEGSVQRAGNTVRITGQLIRAANEGHVWAKNYDRELTAANLFAIQSELAQAIAGELRAAISPQEKIQLERAPTANFAAYEAYARARNIFYARGNDIPAMFREATPLYERAVVLDPNFAEAWAGVSVAYSLAYNRGIERTPVTQVRARDAIQTALRLAPDNPSVILTLARYYTLVEANLERALAESERAARILPNNAELYDTLASIYVRQGKSAEAMTAARKAHELDPRSPSLARSYAIQLINAYRYAAAEEVLQQAVIARPDYLEAGALLATIPLWTRGSTREWDAWLASVPAPSRTNATFQQLHLQITAAKGDAVEYVRLVDSYQREANAGYGFPFALMLAGEAARARTMAARLRDQQLDLVKRDPNRARAWSLLAFAYAALGESSPALEAANRSIATLPDSDLAQICLAKLRRTQLLAWLGRNDEAMTELTQIWWQPVASNRDPLTSFMWAPLKGDPRFEALKKDPRNRQPLY